MNEWIPRSQPKLTKDQAVALYRKKLEQDLCLTMYLMELENPEGQGWNWVYDNLTVPWRLKKHYKAVAALCPSVTLQDCLESLRQESAK